MQPFFDVPSLSKISQPPGLEPVGVKKIPPKNDFFSDSRIITYDAKLTAADILNNTNHEIP